MIFYNEHRNTRAINWTDPMPVTRTGPFRGSAQHLNLLLASASGRFDFVPLPEPVHLPHCAPLEWIPEPASVDSSSVALEPLAHLAQLDVLKMCPEPAGTPRPTCPGTLSGHRASAGQSYHG